MLVSKRSLNLPDPVTATTATLDLNNQIAAIIASDGTADSSRQGNCDTDKFQVGKPVRIAIVNINCSLILLKVTSPGARGDFYFFF